MDRDFLEAIREAPDDDMVRLVWADYLEEDGDPRSEFIRIQCELAQLAEYDRQRRWYEMVEDYYLTNYRREWLAPLIELGVTSAQYRRGLPEVITISVTDFLQNAQELSDCLPSLHTIRFRELPRDADELSRLGEHPLMQNVRGLDLSNSSLSVDQMEAIQNWPQLPRLEFCDFSDNLAFQEGILFAAMFLLRHPIQELRLSSVELRAFEIDQLLPEFCPPYAARLTKLDLSWSACSLEEIAMFYRWGICDALREVSLEGNTQVADTIAQIAQALFEYRWTKLNLSRCFLDGQQVWGFCQGGGLESLEILKLSKNWLGSVGARTLGTTESLKNLKYLDVSECMIQIDGLQELYRSKHLQNTEIEVGGNHLNVFEWSRLKTEFGDRVRR